MRHSKLVCAGEVRESFTKLFFLLEKENKTLMLFSSNLKMKDCNISLAHLTLVIVSRKENKKVKSNLSTFCLAPFKEDIILSRPLPSEVS